VIPPPLGRALRALLLSAALLGLTVAPVLADAVLVESNPEADAVVTEVPDTLTLVFNEPLDAESSSVEVRDEAGETVAEGQLSADEPTTLAAELPELEPGTYEVRYTAGSADGHLVRDTYTFTVEAAPTPSPTASPTPAPSASAVPEPSAAVSPGAPGPSAIATASPFPTAGADPATTAVGGTDVLIPIVAALAILAVLGAVVLRRRRV
jgi:hypothetical protein